MTLTCVLPFYMSSNRLAYSLSCNSGMWNRDTVCRILSNKFTYRRQSPTLCLKCWMSTMIRESKNEPRCSEV